MKVLVQLKTTSVNQETNLGTKEGLVMLLMMSWNIWGS